MIIADDHAVVRKGIKATLAQHPLRFDVVAEVASGEDLLHSLKIDPGIDVAVTDYSMSKDGYDGLRLLRRLRDQHPRLGIVVLTMLDNEALLHGIRSLGIQDIINKKSPEHRLVNLIESSARKSRLALSGIPEATRTLKRGSSSKKCKSNALSPREAETLRMLVQGMSVSEIALKLNRSKKTISAQKHAAMLKLGLTNDAQLFHYLHAAFDGLSLTTEAE